MFMVMKNKDEEQRQTVSDSFPASQDTRSHSTDRDQGINDFFVFIRYN